MKRALFLIALLFVSATPLLAQQQTNEFGIVVGGSRRFVDGAPHPNEDDFIESNFSFGNSSVELYWSMPIEPDLNLKFKGGRMNTQVAIPYYIARPTPTDPDALELNRRDVEGQMQHLEALVEYRFDEPFGSSGLFAGLGYYRMTAPNEDDLTKWGVNAGVNADFPINRRYGVIVEAGYHWVRGDFEPRFLTLGAGLRMAF